MIDAQDEKREVQRELREAKQRNRAQLELAKEHYKEQLVKEVANAVEAATPGQTRYGN